MAKKQMLFKTKGMNKDLSVSAFNPEFSFDNMNLRLSTNENNTLLSWVNEKGTQAIDGTKLSIDTTPWVEAENNNNNRYVQFLYGIPIGTAVLNNQLVIFTSLSDEDEDIKVAEIPLSTLNGSENEETQKVYARDFIYVLEYNKDGDTPIMKGKLIFRGYLGFSTSNPLETIVSYESESIQKVYWVDGVKQPRVINIAADNEYLEKWNTGEEVIHNSEVTAFNFVMNLKLEETVKIKKVTGGNGQFPAGVIQYAFTYYNKNGQESAIFYTSPLLYVSPKERGAAQDEKVDNIFQIKVSNVDTNYDYLRIYSLERTSLNSVPIAKRVQDIKIDPERDSSEYYAFTDTGYSGDSIDPTELLYKGGEFIIAKTMEQKDGTLFLGNLTMERESIEDTLKEDIVAAVHIEDGMRAIHTNESSFAAYKYYSQLTAYDSEDKDNSVPCGGFKRGDYYRLGVQFQHVSGKWSDPICCEHHKKCGYSPVGEEIVNLPVFNGILSKDVASTLYNKGYRKIRPVVVFPKIYDRVGVCQGAVCPTLYTSNNQANHLIGQSSWLFRPTLYKNDQSNTSLAYNPIDDKADVEPSALITYSQDGSTIYGDEMYLRYTNNGMSADDFKVYKEDFEGHGISIWDDYPGSYNPLFIKQVEIQGEYESGDKFKISNKVFTLHSPDFEFDDATQTISFENLICRQVGGVSVTKTFSDIDIQTSSPTIDDSALGFCTHTVSKEGNNGIVSGLFYQDKIVDDKGGNFEAYEKVYELSRWMVYLWNKNGSLNNDISRPSSAGTPSAVLKKKTISNLKLFTTGYWENENIAEKELKDTPVLFNSDDVSIVRLGTENYQGNIDTTLMPDGREGLYFANEGNIVYAGTSPGTPAFINNTTNTLFNSPVKWKTFGFGNAGKDHPGLYKYRVNDININALDGPTPQYITGWIQELPAEIGDDYPDLATKKNGVRMKYKSTPHLVFSVDSNNLLRWNYHSMPIVEICRNDNKAFIDNLFGGTSEDAMKENVWVPCGEPVRLDSSETVSAHWYKSGKDDVTGAHTDAVAQTLDNDNPETSYNNVAEAEADGWKWINDSIAFQYSYGDTYFQRWDCLKTYPFSSEDVNQVVEIGSFMLESHVNADGRYDRNRGMTSNLYMTPQNFNRFNPVYSQVDNFFSYRIQDEDFYKDKNFPNQLTWSKTKTSGADVDLWTNITLASVLELDGDKGEIQKLIRLNDQLLAFQDTGISQVLYNDNVQISSTDGVPIEIANSGKVSGKRYLSNTIGCANKWSMANTPNGIYFMDSINKDIFMFNGQLNNLSQQYGFNTWAKDNIIGVGEGTEWNPKDFKNFVTYYDKLNQDVLFINSEKALAWSERLGTFTSFYDYGETPFFCNLEDTGVWLKPVEVEPEGQEEENPSSHWECKIWRHQTGDYCNFFGNNKPYWMTLVGNPEPQTDKVFTNLEFRACVDGDGTLSTSKDEDGNPVKFTPSTPFDSVETWNEYQHGYTALSIKNGHSMFQHGGSDSALIRKFRIWRCDIPRNNCMLGTPAEGVTWPYSTDAQLGVSRYVRKPQDRMRNPWLYLKLQKNAAGTDEVLDRAEIHDLVMTYFN